MSGRLPYISTPWVLALLVLSACGGEEAITCLDDRSCGAGQRCVQARFGEPGSCEPCATTETPYDGVDNDCSARTPDLDLDGDGDNWDQAPTKPGRDCDDDDSAVGISKAEVCGDGKDNDCDLTVDEVDCGDREPPSVTFVSPAVGAVINGTFTIAVAVSDDVGVTRVELKLSSATLEAQTFTPPVTAQTVSITRDSRMLSDGHFTLQATATDVKGQTTTAVVEIDIDNQSGPTITMVRPAAAGLAYGGSMLIRAEITDPSGVGPVELELDGTVVQTFTTEPYERLLDTTTLPEGMHRVLFRCSDMGSGATSSLETPFLIDNTPPTVTIIAPTANQRLVGVVSARVEALDSNGVAEVRMAGAAGPSPLEFQLNSALFPNGPQTITASAADVAEVSGGGGNVGSASVQVTVENMGGGPTIAITAPAPNDEVFGSTPVTVSVAGTGTVIWVRFSIDGRILFEDRSTPYSADLDFTGLTGAHEIRVEVNSQRGTATAIAPVTVLDAPRLKVSQTISAPHLGAANFQAVELSGDGVPDLLLAGMDQYLIEGYLLNGSWRPGRTHRLSTGPANDIRAIDLDGDGVLEILILHLNELEILRFVSPGAVEAVVLPVPVLPGGLVAFDFGDIDGDGDIDIAATGGTLPTHVLSQGIAGFEIAQTLPAGSGNGTSVQFQDTDLDGDLDLLVTRSGAGGVSNIFTNDGIGGFGVPIALLAPEPAERLAVGDLNGDSYPDILLQMAASGLFAQAIGSSASPGSYTVGTPTSVRAAGGRGLMLHDFDGDGRLDWLISNPNLSAAQIWTNPAGGAPTLARSYSPCDDFGFPKLFDMNGDGELDLLGHCPRPEQLSISYGRGGLDFYSAPALVLPGDVPLAGAAVVDLYGSPDPELITLRSLSANDGVFEVYERSGGEWAQAWTYPSGDLSGTIHSGDWDNSGTTDLLVASDSIVELTAPMAFTLTPYQGQTCNNFIDIDNDGSYEGLSYLTGPITVYPWNGTVPTTEIPTLEPYRVLAGELDADASNGHEVAILSRPFGTITIANRIGQTWTLRNFTATAGVSSFVSGDLNGDARSDFLFGGPGGLTTILGDPVSFYTAPATFRTPGPPLHVAIADMNGDGRGDLIAAQNNRQVGIYLQQSNGRFTTPIKLPAIVSATLLKVTDANGDGEPDIILVHSSGAFPTVINFFSEPF